ncbi:hypothetical protein [Nocardia sp. NPDC057353]
MSTVKDNSLTADAVARTANDSDAVDAVVQQRIAQFRSDDNATMMGGWT